MIFSNKKIYLRLPSAPKKKVTTKRIRFYGIVFLVGMIAGWWGIPALLNYVLIYQTPGMTTDVVLVGSLGQPLAKAVALYKEKKTGRFLITAAVPEKYKQSAKPPCTSRFIKEELVASGIPEKDIDTIDKKCKSMLEWQIMFRAWVHGHNIKSYLCMTELYSTRLTKMVHDQTFSEGDVRIEMLPMSGRTLLRKQWLNIQNNLIRYLYWYWIDYPQLQQSIRYAFGGGIAEGPRYCAASLSFPAITRSKPYSARIWGW